MVDTGDGGLHLSSHAREVLRLLRMFGAQAEQPVRQGVLRNLWSRHLPRAHDEDLEVAVQELRRAGLIVPAKPDGVSLTAQGVGAR